MKKTIILISLSLAVFFLSFTASAQFSKKDIRKLPAFIKEHCDLFAKEATSNTHVYISDIVSNQFYKEFVDSYKKSDPISYQKNLPVSKLWENETLANNYFFHPAYKQFPVFAISKENAQQYCKWLEKTLQIKNPKFKYQVRLAHKGELHFATCTQGNLLLNEYQPEKGKYFTYEEGTNQEFEGPSKSLSFRVVVSVTNQQKVSS